VGLVRAVVAILVTTGCAHGEALEAVPPADNCGVASLVSLARVLCVAPTKQQLNELLGALPGEGASMLQVQEGARVLGLDLLGVEGTLDALAGVPGPKVLVLVDPPHFAVLVRIDAHWAQLMESARVTSVPRSDIERRYSGRALVVRLAQAEGGPRVQLPKFHHQVALAGIGQTVEGMFELRNTGDRDLELQVQECPG